MSPSALRTLLEEGIALVNVALVQTVLTYLPNYLTMLPATHVVSGSVVNPSEGLSADYRESR
jgi:hypothetical protein